MVLTRYFSATDTFASHLSRQQRRNWCSREPFWPFCRGRDKNVEQQLLNRRKSAMVLDYGFPPRKLQTSCTSVASVWTKHERLLRERTNENEILRYCQALLLSTCMLFLSYHGVRHGRTEYSLLENGQVVEGYKHKAVITLSLGYSVPYSLISLLAIGMLAYSLLSKRPRWSLPSIVLYLADLVYDISGAIVVVWLFFYNFPLPTALSYAMGTVLFILGEIWIWLGVLRLYEHRTLK